MTRALIDAHAHLCEALKRYPLAATNLHGARTPSSAGLLDGGTQGGYPTGHSGTATMPCVHETATQARLCRRCGLVADPARTAIRTLDADLLAILRLTCGLFDLDANVPRATLHRLHLATRLVELAQRLELTRAGMEDADQIRRHAGNARQTITDWAWVTGRGTAGDKADDGCRSCSRLGRWEPCAEGQYGNYCRWCGDWYGAHQAMPPEQVLAKRHRGERITSRDLARIYPQRKGVA